MPREHFITSSLAHDTVDLLNQRAEAHPRLAISGGRLRFSLIARPTPLDDAPNLSQ